MLTTRRLLNAATAAATLLIFVVFQQTAAASQPPDEFIRAMGAEAVESLTGEDLSTEERERRFRKIFNRSFDVETIARFTLGRYWRTATEEQRQEYISLFEDFVVQAYAARFREYGGESFRVGQVRDISETEKLVASEIVRPGQSPIAVHWRVRTDPAHRVIDVMVEGISMGITQRDEFAAVIRNSGGKVDSLISALRRRTGRE
jgi:phospholipid transport system substrate-binding protein